MIRVGRPPDHSTYTMLFIHSGWRANCQMYFIPLLTLLVCLIRASGTRDATAVDPASAASSSGESFATGVFASASLRRWPPEFHDGDPTRPQGPALAGERGEGGRGGGRRGRAAARTARPAGWRSKERPAERAGPAGEGRGAGSGLALAERLGCQKPPWRGRGGGGGQ